MEGKSCDCHMIPTCDCHMMPQQCKVLRDYYTSRPKEKKMMTEKVQASLLFRDRKSLYTQT